VFCLKTCYCFIYIRLSNLQKSKKQNKTKKPLWSTLLPVTINGYLRNRGLIININYPSRPASVLLFNI
jgi:hypothetical protein